jgi:hypothetical protein
MWIVVPFLVLVAASYAAYRFADARRLRRLRPRFQEGFAELVRAARAWPKSEYELVDYDTDRYPEDPHHWRTITLRPTPLVSWRIQIEPKRGYALEWRSERGAAHFPRHLGWSKEPWIRDGLVELFAAIKALPPPRTFEEFHKKRQEEFDAFVAGLEAEREAWKARAREAGFVSLEDPLDDMD